MRDDEPPGLTNEERRILAEIEAGLRDDPDFQRGFRRHVRRPVRERFTRASWRWWAAVVVGIGLLGYGLWIRVVWYSAIGFVLVLVAVARLTAGIDLARVRRNLLRLITLDSGSHGDKD